MRLALDNLAAPYRPSPASTPAPLPQAKPYAESVVASIPRVLRTLVPPEPMPPPQPKMQQPTALQSPPQTPPLLRPPLYPLFDEIWELDRSTGLIGLAYETGVLAIGRFPTSTARRCRELLLLRHAGSADVAIAEAAAGVRLRSAKVQVLAGWARSARIRAAMQEATVRHARSAAGRAVLQWAATAKTAAGERAAVALYTCTSARRALGKWVTAATIAAAALLVAVMHARRFRGKALIEWAAAASASMVAAAKDGSLRSAVRRWALAVRRVLAMCTLRTHREERAQQLVLMVRWRRWRRVVGGEQLHKWVLRDSSVGQLALALRWAQWRRAHATRSMRRWLSSNDAHRLRIVTGERPPAPCALAIAALPALSIAESLSTTPTASHPLLACPIRYALPHLALLRCRHLSHTAPLFGLQAKAD